MKRVFTRVASLRLKDNEDPSASVRNVMGYTSTELSSVLISPYASNLKYQQTLKKLKLKQKVLRKVLDQALQRKQRITDNRTATIDHSKEKLDTNFPVIELEKAKHKIEQEKRMHNIDNR